MHQQQAQQHSHHAHQLHHPSKQHHRLDSGVLQAPQPTDDDPYGIGANSDDDEDMSTGKPVQTLTETNSAGHSHLLTSSALLAERP
eukprot:156069-Rhodomonas_salina.1